MNQNGNHLQKKFIEIVASTNYEDLFKLEHFSKKQLSFIKENQKKVFKALIKYIEEDKEPKDEMTRRIVKTYYGENTYILVDKLEKFLDWKERMNNY